MFKRRKRRFGLLGQKPKHLFVWMQLTAASSSSSSSAADPVAATATAATTPDKAGVWRLVMDYESPKGKKQTSHLVVSSATRLLTGRTSRSGPQAWKLSGEKKGRATLPAGSGERLITLVNYKTPNVPGSRTIRLDLVVIGEQMYTTWVRFLKRILIHHSHIDNRKSAKLKLSKLPSQAKQAPHPLRPAQQKQQTRQEKREKKRKKRKKVSTELEPIAQGFTDLKAAGGPMAVNSGLGLSGKQARKYAM
mmetsp:Transcript_18006/g.25326  ORF Transcript_18006/g.25326 Transcript_18006/m.25326 type:complete len:249 (-) Transcript_18006:129-875(-)